MQIYYMIFVANLNYRFHRIYKGSMAARQSPSVAVIGGGISGLVTAVRLGQLGITDVTVFDTGKPAK